MSISVRWLACVLGLALACCPETGWRPQAPDEADAAAAVLADDRCAANAPDCNVCAHDVPAQFAEASRQGQRRTWGFASPAWADMASSRAYSPLHGHVQGFVRLNLEPEAYAMVHDGDRMASISFIGVRAGSLELESLYRLHIANGHTSGAFVLGRYVGFIAEARRLALVDSYAAFERRSIAVQHVMLSHPNLDEPFMADPKGHGLTDWSGGVAVAKLQSGKYLLLANAGGEFAGNSHFFEFGAFQGVPDGAALAAQEVGHAEFPIAARLCAEHHRSENVALITECGTRHLYAVHVGSNDAVRFGKTEVGGHRTFWRLSRVVELEGEKTLEPIGVYLRPAHMAYCHGRSAGSAFVDPATRRIDLLCHERAQGEARNGRWRFWSEMAGGAAQPIVELSP
jgi:hypothetical protein